MSYKCFVFLIDQLLNNTTESEATLSYSEYVWEKQLGLGSSFHYTDVWQCLDFLCLQNVSCTMCLYLVDVTKEMAIPHDPFSLQSIKVCLTHAQDSPKVVGSDLQRACN